MQFDDLLRLCQNQSGVAQGMRGSIWRFYPGLVPRITRLTHIAAYCDAAVAWRQTGCRKLRKTHRM